MKVGILGYAGVGKTTVFSALTGKAPGVNIPGEVHRATVEVADTRLEKLRDVYQPRKYTPARFEVEDLVPLPQGEVKGRGEVLNSLREPEALLIVLGLFEQARMVLPGALGSARAQLQSVRDDLLLLDMELVEKRVGRIEDRLRRGGGDREGLRRELQFVQILQTALEEGTPLPETDDRRTALMYTEMRLFQHKPTVIVVNVDEGKAGDAAELEAEAHLEALCAPVEVDIAELEGDDRQSFLDEYGLAEPAGARLTRSAYQALDLISFFTVGEDEVRAWPIVRGSDAVTSAGKIHSDLARGFIRAEVTPFELVKDAADIREFKAATQAELKGKDYVVEDGDILNIRFSV